MRDICDILDVNRSSFYYQPRADPSEEVLRAEIETLARRYPRYGYRRITQLLVRQGYTVGTRRVAGLMKEMNLLISIKRAGQTTRSLQGEKAWSNLLETLEVCHPNQVWIGDICTAIGNLVHSLNQDYDRIQSHRKKSLMAKRKRRTFTPEFKAKVVLEALRGESSQAKLCQRHNISEEQLSKWKQQFVENVASLFESRGKPSKDETERIAELEQLVGRLSVAMDIHKKAETWLSEKTNPNTQGGSDSSECEQHHSS